MIFIFVFYGIVIIYVCKWLFVFVFLMLCFDRFLCTGYICCSCEPCIFFANLVKASLLINVYMH